jgi:hypothetical protein
MVKITPVLTGYHGRKQVRVETGEPWLASTSERAARPAAILVASATDRIADRCSTGQLVLFRQSSINSPT